ncbi:nitroreductase/quinone reductase family protein [Gordonia sp. CPCC 205515]|uniref:nitroreductase/quinone reductase family protein n=1 Tax=Gordonia sp. CPCC 205515 TaxID=3140791 RepID=UPI003AF3496F
MKVIQSSASIINKAVIPFLGLPGVKSLTKGSFTVLRYTGRKSGTQIELPVQYRRSGNTVIVGVGAAGHKTWWRNFTGDGAPIELTLDGTWWSGHAVSSRNAKGQVQVRITLAQS